MNTAFLDPLRRYWQGLRRSSFSKRSEVSKCRERLQPFCRGNGIDIGCGGDPITPSAVRIDLPEPYSKIGSLPPQLCGDARNLIWFRDGVLDYVFSSHVLEDFLETEEILQEWLRVLRPGGCLVLFCPDEAVYRVHCTESGQIYNQHHQHADFSLGKVKGILMKIGGVQIVREVPLIDRYSWELVVRKCGK